MKGLLYRDFYLGKKTYILYGIIAAGIGFFGLLVSLSSVCGNLVNYADNNPGGFETTIKVFIYVPIFMVVMAVQGVWQCICSDYKSGWMLYGYNLPVKRSVTVGAHYITGILVVAAGMIIGLAHTLIISGFANVELGKKDFLIMLFLGFVGLVEITLFIPMSLLLKTEKAVSTASVLGGTVVWLIAMVQMAVAVESELEAKVARDFKLVKGIISDYWMIIVPVMLCVSFLCSVKILKAKRL